MSEKIRKKIRKRDALVVSGLGDYSLTDTALCGQVFSFEEIIRDGEYVEYIVPIGHLLVTVGQQKRGELIFYGVCDEDFERVVSPFFSLSMDFGAIADKVSEGYKKDWFTEAVKNARGIAILKQDAWEALFSFIVSQNNNIPRIKKILRRFRLEYGKNLAEGLGKCPLGKHGECPSHKACTGCGICYSFPEATAVVREPEKLLSANPGFRYRYLVDAARRVADGKTRLDEIEGAHSYAYSLEELKKIVGVGDKVASCVALFGLGNLDAFPIDVWMKRAIDTYFDGKLDPAVFGKYAGVAQQYIFHYIRNIENK